MNGDGGGKRR
ncbi:hypothetical protein A2U01_0076660, partial [Trifolium medium]|nr:hypothetical protein [Trifolium medium]